MSFKAEDLMAMDKKQLVRLVTKMSSDNKELLNSVKLMKQVC